MTTNGFQPPGGTAAATAVVAETSFGQAPAVGASLDYARADHTHGTPASPSGLWMSPVDVITTKVAPTLTGGNLTTGFSFMVGNPITVTGIRFAWGGVPPLTIRAALRSTTGGVLASADVVTAGIGIYSAVFGAPVVCPVLAGTAARYAACIWETTATQYTSCIGMQDGPGMTAAGAGAFLPSFISPDIVAYTWCLNYGAGYAFPANNGNWAHFPVEPILA